MHGDLGMANRNETKAILIETDGSVEAVEGLGKHELWRDIRRLVRGAIEPVLVGGQCCAMLFNDAGRLCNMEPNEIATAIVPDEMREAMSAPLVGPVVLVRLPRNPSHFWQLFTEEDCKSVQQAISTKAVV